mmetsp:Transcript_84135/g.238683  ORF Transcript_84135/g.238683 Transcript_84135/m.238683 type:complete len:301 (+) Transcript_84135:548-1450(+)
MLPGGPRARSATSSKRSCRNLKQSTSRYPSTQANPSRSSMRLSLSSGLYAKRSPAPAWMVLGFMPPTSSKPLRSWTTSPLATPISTSRTSTQRPSEPHARAAWRLFTCSWAWTTTSMMARFLHRRKIWSFVDTEECWPGNTSNRIHVNLSISPVFASSRAPDERPKPSGRTVPSERQTSRQSLFQLRGPLSSPRSRSMSPWQPSTTSKGGQDLMPLGSLSMRATVQSMLCTLKPCRVMLRRLRPTQASGVLMTRMGQRAWKRRRNTGGLESSGSVPTRKFGRMRTCSWVGVGDREGRVGP